MQVDTIKPLPRLDDEPTFNEAWQAQVLAIAQNLIATGAIAADDWSNALGAALSRIQVDAQTDTVENYYQAALEALETLLPVRDKILLVLQPVTPFGAVKRPLPARDLERFIAMAVRHEFDVRVVPQTHKTMNLP